MSRVSIKNTFLAYKKVLIKLLGTEALFSNQITKACRKLFGNKYIGTYAQDAMPLNLHGYMIINVDLTGKPGSHWVALVLEKHYCYVYDSFGRTTKRLLPVLAKKLKQKHIISLDADHKPEQFGDTKICGQLAMAFLLTVEKFGVEKVVKVI